MLSSRLLAFQVIFLVPRLGVLEIDVDLYGLDAMELHYRSKPRSNRSHNRELLDINNDSIRHDFTHAGNSYLLYFTDKCLNDPKVCSLRNWHRTHPCPAERLRSYRD
jgi:hypothetical protein